MTQVASRERRSSTSSTNSNSSSGSRSPRVQYRSFWAVLEPPQSRTPTRKSSHSTLPKSSSPPKQAHRQHFKTSPTTPKLVDEDVSDAEVEEHARRVRQHEQKVQLLMGPTKSLTIQVPTLPKGKVIIHCLRHAQAQHNIATIPRPQRLAIHDPTLTSHGRIQATQLKKTLGASQNITHVLCSPLRRTVQTALIGLSPILSTSRKLIAYPDLREWGSSPCSTGSKMCDLMLGIKDKNGLVDTSLVDNDWEVNREERGSLARRERVRRVREDIFQLGQESLKVGGTWRGNDVGIGLESGRNVEIVLVSHAAFLGTLEGTDIERLRNAQWRTYEFASEEDIKRKNCSRYSLVETRESKKRNDPVTPASQSPPPSPRKISLEKSKDSSRPFVLDEAALITKKLHVEREKEIANIESLKQDPFWCSNLRDESNSNLADTATSQPKLSASTETSTSLTRHSSNSPSQELADLKADSKEPPIEVSRRLLAARTETLTCFDEFQSDNLEDKIKAAEETLATLKRLHAETLKVFPPTPQKLVIPEEDDSNKLNSTMPIPTLLVGPEPSEAAIILKENQNTSEKVEIETPVLTQLTSVVSYSKLETQDNKRAVSRTRGLNRGQSQDMLPPVTPPTATTATEIDCDSVVMLEEKEVKAELSSSAFPEIEDKLTTAKTQALEELQEGKLALVNETSLTPKHTHTKSPKRTLESEKSKPLVQNLTPPKTSILEESKDNLLTTDEKLLRPKKLHRKKSSEKLTTLPKDMSVPLVPRKPSTDRPRDKPIASIEISQSPRKVHSEKSRDKLKSSRSRSSTPEEVPLTLRRLFAEMSREKSKRSPSPEALAAPSSSKKLHSERSKDRLKSQKRHSS